MKPEIVWLILGMALVTAGPRVLPVAVLSRFHFPRKLVDWLSFIAPAVLAALLAVSVLAPEGRMQISLDNHYLWAFIPTILVAVKTRSLFYTMSAGILIMAAINYFL